MGRLPLPKKGTSYFIMMSVSDNRFIEMRRY